MSSIDPAKLKKARHAALSPVGAAEGGVAHSCSSPPFRPLCSTGGITSSPQPAHSRSAAHSGEQGSPARATAQGVAGASTVLPCLASGSPLRVLALSPPHAAAGSATAPDLRYSPPRTIPAQAMSASLLTSGTIATLTVAGPAVRPATAWPRFRPGNCHDSPGKGRVSSRHHASPERFSPPHQS
mgnify:CR=1 FL=1